MKLLILGCGWVGEELARFAIQQNVQVLGTVTSLSKQQKQVSEGIECIVVNFDELAEFPDSVLFGTYDYVLTSVPANKRLTLQDVAKRFKHIQRTLQEIVFQKHIFLSSVGIYPDQDGVFEECYTEQHLLDENLYLAESLMLEVPNSVVYRLGGLFGKERIFAKYFEDKICTTGDQLANFVHVNDVVPLIWKGFTYQLVGNVFNVVSPEHPPKEQVIRQSAQKYGYQLPSSFEPDQTFRKIVDGSLLTQQLNYQFIYPSPLDF